MNNYIFRNTDFSERRLEKYWYNYVTVILLVMDLFCEAFVITKKSCVF